MADSFFSQFNGIGGGGGGGSVPSCCFIVQCGTGTNSTERICASNNAFGAFSGALGKGNSSCGEGSAIMGGATNTISTLGINSFIGGGEGNQVTNACSSILGGCTNTASGAFSTIGGGCRNTASACFASILGGSCSIASGIRSTIVGGFEHVASGQDSFVGGGLGQLASGLQATIVGGLNNYAQADGGFVGGGTCNNVCNLTSGCLAYGAVVVGGVGNNTTGGTWDLASCAFCVVPTICNAGIYSFVGGGFFNRATGCNSTSVGGICNTAFGGCSFIGGGIRNNNSGCVGTISGGGSNNICNSTCATIGGGGFNIIICSIGSTIAGGASNRICPTSLRGFIGGGFSNCMNSIDGFIGGGNSNSVCNSTSGCLAYGAVVVGGVGNNTTGGTFNTSLCCFSVSPTICNAGCVSFVGGGFQNSATGLATGILGGCANLASCACSFIVGSNITTDRVCTTFVNNLSIKNIPTSSVGLPSGSVYSNAGVLTIV